jgi:hypothetical protein
VHEQLVIEEHPQDLEISALVQGSVQEMERFLGRIEPHLVSTTPEVKLFLGASRSDLCTEVCWHLALRESLPAVEVIRKYRFFETQACHGTSRVAIEDIPER